MCIGLDAEEENGGLEGETSKEREVYEGGGSRTEGRVSKTDEHRVCVCVTITRLCERV